VPTVCSIAAHFALAMASVFAEGISLLIMAASPGIHAFFLTQTGRYKQEIDQKERKDDGYSAHCILTSKVEIEALRSKLRGIFDHKGIIILPIHPHTSQLATGNALVTGFKTIRENIL
jgi:hypothetical protein